MAGLLWSIIVLWFILWVAGFALHIAGGLIHLLLVVIGILVIINLISGRGARVIRILSKYKNENVWAISVPRRSR